MLLSMLLPHLSLIIGLMPDRLPSSADSGSAHLATASRESIRKASVAELRAILKSYKVSVSGRRQDLLDRCEMLEQESLTKYVQKLTSLRWPIPSVPSIFRNLMTSSNAMFIRAISFCPISFDMKMRVF